MIEIISFLVIDTFIIISLNEDTIKNNLKNFFGIETGFAIIGYFLGTLILNYINKTLFYYCIASLIIIVQIIDINQIKLPKIITSLLLGIDSLFVFTIMPFIAIPLLTILELIAITTATYIGKKFVNKLPYSNYISNLIMIAIAIKLII